MDIIPLLGLGVIGLGGFLVYLLVQLPKQYVFKYFAIPLYLGLCLMFASQLPSILGTPREGYPKKEFRLVGYRTKFTEHKLMIEAWVTENGESKLYEFPYNPQIGDELASMAGQPGSVGRFHGTGEDNANGYGMGLSTISIPFPPLPPKTKSPINN